MVSKGACGAAIARAGVAMSTAEAIAFGGGDWQATRAAQDKSMVAACARRVQVLKVLRVLRVLRVLQGLRMLRMLRTTLFINGSWPVPGHCASVKMNSRQPGGRRRQRTVRVWC